MPRIKIEDLPRQENVETKVRTNLTGGTLMSPLSLLGAGQKAHRGSPLFRLGVSILRLALQ